MSGQLTERQGEILDAALHIIGAEGLGGLTIRTIARRVGVTEPAVYRHFENKLALLSALLDRVDAQIRSGFEETFGADSVTGSADASAGEKLVDSSADVASASRTDLLRQFLHRLFEQFARTPALVPLLLTDELFQQELRLREQVNSMIETQIARFTRLVRHFQTHGAWRSDLEAEDQAVVVLGTIRLHVVRELTTGHALRAPMLADRVADTIGRLLRRVD